MNVRKAVITAAGPGQKGLLLQSLVDRDGGEKTALEILLEEVVAAGAEEIALVVNPADEAGYRNAAGNLAPRLTLLPQKNANGYGGAILLAKDFVAGQPFLHLVGDHLFNARGDYRCAKQVVELAKAERCAVSAVQPTRENLLRYYGTVGGRRIPQHADVYEIQKVIEKPTPSQAEQALNVPGIRAGFYLCFFGIHVLTPTVMELLATAKGSPLGLTETLAELARRERYYALEMKGQRFNIGVKYGLLTAQLALALDGVDREKIMAQIIDLLAHRA